MTDETNAAPVNGAAPETALGALPQADREYVAKLSREELEEQFARAHLTAAKVMQDAQRAMLGQQLTTLALVNLLAHNYRGLRGADGRALSLGAKIVLAETAGTLPCAEPDVRITAAAADGGPVGPGRPPAVIEVEVDAPHPALALVRGGAS